MSLRPFVNRFGFWVGSRISRSSHVSCSIDTLYVRAIVVNRSHSGSVSVAFRCKTWCLMLYPKVNSFRFFWLLFIFCSPERCVILCCCFLFARCLLLLSFCLCIHVVKWNIGKIVLHMFLTVSIFTQPKSHSVEEETCHFRIFAEMHMEQSANGLRSSKMFKYKNNVKKRRRSVGPKIDRQWVRWKCFVSSKCMECKVNGMNLNKLKSFVLLTTTNK